MQHRPPIDLSNVQLDKDGKLRYALYLPAISTFYGKIVAKQRMGEHIAQNRIPKGFDRGVEGMNFLNLEEGYFTYKYGLYSAGHAQLDLNKTMTEESMVQQRDRSNTLILGDSGGFQIGKGVLKFDWLNFEGPAANKVRQRILEWLEVTADWSMMLDVPTWACDHTHSPKTGLKTFDDCLEKTRFNNDYFLTNRLGQTKFLNVLQGNDWPSAEKWYAGVKEYSDPAIWGARAAEGWAFGGSNMCNMSTALKRIMTLREDGLLTDKNWIHFLGTAQLDWACYLTSIQRQIRQHINENLTISFDCASPFISTAHGLVYTNPQHSPKRWSVIMEKATDTKALSGSTASFPFESEIGRRLTMGDLCYYAPGMLNKQGKEGKTSWDSFSYALMMAHNVYTHIIGVQRANQLMDVERVTFKPDWRTWQKVKPRDVSDEYSVWVPRNVLYFDRFVEELFNTKTKEEAFAMMDEPRAREFLNSLEGTRLQGGPAKNLYDNLFEIERVTSAKEIDLTNPDDDELRKLSDELDD